MQNVFCKREEGIMGISKRDRVVTQLMTDDDVHVIQVHHRHHPNDVITWDFMRDQNGRIKGKTVRCYFAIKLGMSFGQVCSLLTTLDEINPGDRSALEREMAEFVECYENIRFDSEETRNIFPFLCYGHRRDQKEKVA